ncbi:MAG: ABC transporter permease [Phycisphaerales bacterium]|nr:ABC transporter permease [Phycisphaerales bacterium]
MSWALPRRLIAELGRRTLGMLSIVGGTTLLAVNTMTWLFRSLRGDVRLGRQAISAQIVRIGTRSIGIVLVVSGCIGLILAMAMFPPLEQFGQQASIANIVAIAITRELGPMISAIVLTGFAGASIAAELGTMVVGEEIEALESHALNPIRFLVLPRLIATVVSLLVLTVMADIMAILASAIVTTTAFGVSWQVYIDNTLTELSTMDFMTGMIKAATFATMLAGLACYNGLKVSGGAAGVGKATTDTVVQTIVSVIIVDMLYTAVFLQLGWT